MTGVQTCALPIYRTQIPNVTSVELSGIDLTRCGLEGSPTHVKSTFVPVHDSNVVMIQEETAEEASRKLIALLSDEHVI